VTEDLHAGPGTRVRVMGGEHDGRVGVVESRTPDDIVVVLRGRLPETMSFGHDQIIQDYSLRSHGNPLGVFLLSLGVMVAAVGSLWLVPVLTP
jgi:hypothetical protein